MLSIGVASLGGCAAALEDGGYFSQCSLPTDQNKTLTGRWRSAPIYVAFRDGHFNTYEQTLIMDAADVWNRYSTAVHGYPVIDYGTRTVPRTSPRDKPSGGICSLSVVNASGNYTGSVVLYKLSAWPVSYAPTAIAITQVCSATPTAAIPIQPIYNSMIEINYQNFFVQGKQVPDLTTLLVHEFGHMLGLDHSCASNYDPTSKTHPPLCSSSTLDPLYYEAAMYPTVSFSSTGAGMVRSSLNSNDQGRTNCLYGAEAL